MKTWTKPWARGLLLFALLSTWGRAARATPDFPAVVVKTLGLSKVEVDPPQGCTLCHTTDSGGKSLRAFGALVQQYGAQPYQASSLVQALAEAEQKEPRLIADIKAGRDPNDDPAASSQPTPEYGCSAARRPGTGARGLVVWPLVIAVLGAIRLGLRRRRWGPGRALRGLVVRSAR